MKKQYTYTYTVLRYVHDVTSGEFVNVGVALYASEARYVGALCRTTYGRLSKVFPGVNAGHFKALMRHIQNRFEESGERLSSELQFASQSDVIEIAQSVLPKDDSSLQWSPSGSGRTDDPALALEKLFNRMVMRYEDKQAASTRTDEDVWRHFKKDLEGQRVLQYFKPKTISVQDDEIEFQHSWKNGKWHCLEPISFDMATADSIKDKAHRWMGQLASVQGAADQFKVYLLIGAPQEENLQPAFLRAVSMLNRMPGDNEIVLEKDAPKLAVRIAGEVADHERTD
ncbi:MAG: DUF3037 domain-containing protein [Gemmatimonadota bacterium]|nr:DUF3037 domain-containing protein [Gemmatimonadota bacterium]